MVVASLRDTVSTLLDRSQILVAELDPIDIVADTYLYALALPDGYEGYRINRPTLVLMNSLLLRASIDYRMNTRTILQLRETPTEATEDAIQVSVSLSLDDIQDADLTDLQEWYAAIVSGVKSRLMLAPGKPWTDQQTGMMYRSEFNDGVSRAMAFVATDGSNEPMRLRM